MGKSDYYLQGSWNAQCDRCGFKYKESQLRKEWTGLRVCSGEGTNDCWEPRNEQDFVRGKRDQQAPPWVRPESPDRFLGTNEANTQWVVRDGLWDDSGAWDDTEFWKDGPDDNPANVWIMASGAWNDAGIWNDNAQWEDGES